MDKTVDRPLLTRLSHSFSGKLPMAIAHAISGEVVSIQPFGANVSDAQTVVLVKTKALEIIRMVILSGKKIQEHQVRGEVVVQCLEGRVAFNCGGTQQFLDAGHMLYLSGDEPHSLEGIVDASLLVTILLAQ